MRHRGVEEGVSRSDSRSDLSAKCLGGVGRDSATEILLDRIMYMVSAASILVLYLFCLFQGLLWVMASPGGWQERVRLLGPFLVRTPQFQSDCMVLRLRSGGSKTRRLNVLAPESQLTTRHGLEALCFDEVSSFPARLLFPLRVVGVIKGKDRLHIYI